jgi:hypothetical protein
LSGIARAAQDRAAREQDRAASEQEEREKQKRARDDIFQGVQRLKRLRADTLPSDPRRALVVALVSVRPPPTEDLEAYEDKERAQALQDDLAAFESECEGRLSEADQRAVATCIHYLCFQEMLTLLIGYARMKEHEADLRAKLKTDLEGESKKLQQLRQTAKHYTDRKWRFIKLGLWSVALGFVVVAVFKSGAWAGLVGLSIWFGMGSIIWGLLKGSSLREKCRQEVLACSNRVDQLQKKLAMRSKIDVPLANDAAKKFGENLGSADYRRIFEERVPLIKEVLRITGEIPDDLAGISVNGFSIADALAVNEGMVREVEGLAGGRA